MRLRLESQEHQLDTLFSTVEKQPDDEIKAYLSKYLCVRTSGFLENVVKNLISEYVTGSTPKPIENYVSREMRNLTNLDDKKLCNFLKKFDPTWEENFLKEISERQKSSLRSVISNRNNIAHGNQDSISFIQMKQYYEDIKEVVQLLKGIIKK